jgi:hypothetical protein
MLAMGHKFPIMVKQLVSAFGLKAILSSRCLVGITRLVVLLSAFTAIIPGKHACSIHFPPFF